LSANRQLSFSNVRLGGNSTATYEMTLNEVENLSMSDLAIM
jgi:hypothetical protein